MPPSRLRAIFYHPPGHGTHLFHRIWRPYPTSIPGVAYNIQHATLAPLFITRGLPLQLSHLAESRLVIPGVLAKAEIPLMPFHFRAHSYVSKTKNVMSHIHGQSPQ